MPSSIPATYGFSEADMDRPIFIDNVLGLETADAAPDLIARCGPPIAARSASNSCISRIRRRRPGSRSASRRSATRRNSPTKGKRAILERLTAAEVFERFLDRKYTGTKRFGLDGGETLIPALEQILKRGSQLGVERGGARHGPSRPAQRARQFHGQAVRRHLLRIPGQPANPEDVQGSADVKYHLGTSADREFDGKVVHLSLTANPSHLEAVNTVVLGKVRAKQQQKKRQRAQPDACALLLHGDAAFAGQGLVAETLDLSELKGYRIGGTIHFIVNNQIGFTTNPVQSRSGPYCSEVAKIVQAPIFHVNGDDPEAVVHVARIATEFRQQFKNDVVIDMFCYRRFGHNESDEPAFTQPLMYQTIAKHPTTRAIYAERLEKEGTIAAGEGEQMVADFQQAVSNANSRRPPATSRTRPTGWKAPGRAWRSPRATTGAARPPCRCEALQRVGKALTQLPAGLQRQPQDRCACWRAAGRRSKPARTSTGRRARRSPSARCWTKAYAGPPLGPGCAAAAPSPSAMRC